MRMPSPRTHLLHVVRDIRTSGTYSMAAELAQYMPNWQHTLLCENTKSYLDADMVVHAQGVGLDVLETKAITEEQLDELGATRALLYNVRNHAVEANMPSLYYSYGDWLPGMAPTVVPSGYAAQFDRTGKPTVLASSSVPVIPPMINTRGLRRMSGPPGPFTVGILTSGNHDKYPGDLVIAMLGRLKPDIRVMVTTLPRYPHTGVELALDAERARRTPRVVCCPVHPSGGTQYTVRADVLVFGTAPGYYEPYGRMVVEAMALGKPVVVERKGVFGTVLEHGRQALMYDTVDEAVDHVCRLKSDNNLRAKLGANGQLWASWQDITVHIGGLKELLNT